MWLRCSTLNLLGSACIVLIPVDGTGRQQENSQISSPFYREIGARIGTWKQLSAQAVVWQPNFLSHKAAQISSLPFLQIKIAC